ncbi:MULTISPECIES: TRM11 family SAM-dependent methyltransferase [Fervidicoccus]|uniref:Bifunctional demethylmenaquinone methyltransferase/2-methoxy-6-polyprenyl-1,4-benzoquinol methylase UbiE n=2 Tax=Fervidicoccus fontis TaxID=683846 RepID=A0A2J6N2A7_9CREN|nr:RsmD family RNA methyltransferase [Fervidicoccus fontis]AFH42978.1 putative DNA modification methylase [Fervidicoccus fontis Kam940]PMB75472.1 MAG: bifunctional demethylmenaquinone methyltransferase/2-methoxy-6-polyprenyl-1,4-benzoquinol methylase UbiE [Fervidicoccus fontis]PMB77337.1 MAG: bifunctional demethylmenaquinone methyltransferase/2-methoxy-6-polyprenyl-1,4-benzoquinol methylase UbiE [Fervidicoccus fontis]
MPLFYALLSGKYPCLSRSEFISLLEFYEGNIVLELTNTTIFEVEDETDAINIQVRSSTIKEVGRVIGIIPSKGEPLFFKYCPNGKIYIKPHRIQGFLKSLDGNALVSIALSFIKKNCIESRKEDKKTVRVIAADGVLIIGELLSDRGKGDIISQNPHNLPFYKPGALNFWFARLLVNLSISKEGRVFYDPFCGTGSLPLSALNDWEFISICSDIRKDMCYGAKRNLKTLSKVNEFEIIRADARHLPIRERSIGFVATDPPYGRSVKSLFSDSTNLSQDSLKELANILDFGGKIVFSLDRNIAEKLIIPEGLKIKSRCPMYVHNRLTRIIMVMQKVE